MLIFSSPLRSALAALLFIESNNGPSSESDVKEQAAWWSGHYSENGNASKFIEKSLKFDINNRKFFQDWFTSLEIK